MLRSISSLCAIAILTIGCSQSAVRDVPARTPTAGESPTASAAMPAVDPASTAAIQPVLDQLSVALIAQDRDQLRALGDPDERVVTAMLQELQQSVSEQNLNPESVRGFRIVAAEQRSATLIEATIARPWDGRLLRWLFRTSDGHWRISQAKPDELGVSQNRAGSGFALTFSAWDADLADALFPLLNKGIAAVDQRLAVSGLAPITIILRPRVETVAEMSKGFYAPGLTAANDTIQLISSGAAIGSFDPSQTWVDAIGLVARHEYVHRVHDHGPLPVPLEDTPDWLAEGLAEYIAGADHLSVPQFRQIIDAGELLSFCQLPAPPLTTPRGVLYGTSELAVRYIVEEQGGMTAFWSLLEHLNATEARGTARMEAALQATWQQSCAGFDQQWHAWIAAQGAAYPAD
ncbi:MAG: hypothetical protein HC828_03555 [Blastochloris sp.]|nr:hypothetical protein [Blastochloris sp.]